VLGGHSDWRLPRIDELETLVDYTRYDPAINSVFDCHLGYYWSSSTSAFAASAWHIIFGDGYAGWYDKTDYSYVQCVRLGPFWSFDPSDHFEASSPTTVHDTYWGYTWQQADDGVPGRGIKQMPNVTL
jgi:hypothetical protein